MGGRSDGAAFAIGSVVGLLVGLFVAWLVWYAQPVSTVTVVNRTARPIAAVRLERADGSNLVGAIPPGASRRTRFFLTDKDSGYAVEVTFADGSRLARPAEYLPGADHYTETVSETGITSHLGW